MGVIGKNHISFKLTDFFSVFGCADVEVPEGAWYKRDGDFAAVGCEKEDLSWSLHCEGTEWKGIVGNCPIESELCYVDDLYF